MQIQPQKNLAVTRALDPNDTDTLYVKAFIYHLKTNNTQLLLASFGLTAQGENSFLYNWKIKAQQADEGDWIRVDTKVYSDSGYTTLNSNYGVVANTYLVKQEVKNYGGGGMGKAVGVGVDYDRIRKMINQAIANNKPQRPALTVNPTPVNVNLGSVTQLLQKVVIALTNSKQTAQAQKEKTATLIKTVSSNFEEVKAAITANTDILNGSNQKVGDAAEVMALIPLIHTRMDRLTSLFTAARQNFNSVKISTLKKQVETEHEDLVAALAPVFKMAEDLKFLYDREDEEVQ